MTTAPQTETVAKKDTQKLQRAIVDGLEDVKAQDIAVFDTEHLSALFERVIVASGTSNRQTKALAASVRDAVREAGFPKPRIEGEENGEWIIVDCGQAVVHVMQPAIRQYYHLEELWGEKPVRLKFGAAKPLPKAEEAPKPAAKSPAKKASAKKLSPEAAKKAAKAKAKALAESLLAPERPVIEAPKRAAKKTAAAPAPAKKAAAKTAVKTVAKTPAKKVALKTIVVKAPVAVQKQQAAAKKAAKTAPKTAPKKTAPRKA
ncbi:ribosome silencing factor [Rhodoferax koreense]|uniref:Ribosomal silencing factor RsfS n=1 Tax=Rhodoferax koreensis TaxID=1842727 RepID=A0A1P8JWF7_9BURK|nr:ribosome silencing factor [Rhodoferax koreense]APW38099.1 ribosome silencing factor [Rhodoferax koreense]